MSSSGEPNMQRPSVGRVVHYVSYGTPGGVALAGARVMRPETSPRRAYSPPDRVKVEVSRELLEQLGEWSRPVQVKIEHTDNGYEMITRDPFPG